MVASVYWEFYDSCNTYLLGSIVGIVGCFGKFKRSDQGGSV